jgi:hypothetical protein
VTEKSDAGMFGKLFRRGGRVETPAMSQTNNPVIQIQAPQRGEVEEVEALADDMAPEPAEQVAEAPRPRSIRYEETAPAPVYRRPERRPEPPAKPVQPVYAAPAVSQDAQGADEVASVEQPVVAEAVEEEPEVPVAASDEPQAMPEEESAEPATVEAPEHKAVRMISRLKARDIAPRSDQMQEFSPAPQAQPEPQAEAKRQGMVNWTFTPPPDISANEVKSGMAPKAPAWAAHQPHAAQQVERAAAHPAEPDAFDPAPPVSIREVHGTKIAVETSRFDALRAESTGSEKISDKKYNSIASKEYTEISKAYASGNSQGTLHDELLHLAAVCMAWADAIEKRMASGSRSKAA